MQRLSSGAGKDVMQTYTTQNGHTLRSNPPKIAAHAAFDLSLLAGAGVGVEGQHPDFPIVALTNH